MYGPFRVLILLSFVFAALLPADAVTLAQDRSHEQVIRSIEGRGFRNISGLERRGGNYVFQAVDRAGVSVSVVMNAATGEIVGLSKVLPLPKN